MATEISQATTMLLENRIAVVTSASRGIGREISMHLASLGARLDLNYASNSTQADSLAAELNSRYSCSTDTPRAVTVQGDVSDPDAVQAMFDRAEQAFGSQAHILVACAGILNPKYPLLADTTIEDFDEMFRVNARGTFLLCREAAKPLPSNEWGRIVTFSSSIMETLLPGYGAYTATNAAVETMTKILTKELQGTGVTTNVVAPGPVKTDLFFGGKDEDFVKKVTERSSGRIGETTDIAPVVGFLVSEAAGWVSGQVIRVNGGFV